MQHIRLTIGEFSSRAQDELCCEPINEPVSACIPAAVPGLNVASRAAEIDGLREIEFQD